MLDRRFVLENADLVRRNCAERGSQADVDRFVALEAQRKAKQAELETLNRQANEVSKSIGKAKDAAERDARKEEGRRLREATTALAGRDRSDRRRSRRDPQDDSQPVASRRPARRRRSGQSGNPPRPARPAEVRFPAARSRRAGRAAGSDRFRRRSQSRRAGFYFLKNDAVLLAMALERYAVDLLMAEGFTPTITPDLARNEILHGTGYIPRGPETQIYSIADSDLSLVATAEITLGGLLSDEILDAEQLPIKVCGISHCFRTEAGAGGRASRGLYRVHQFSKVEMFAFTLPDQSDAMLEYFRDLECRIFDGLGLAYRVVDTATGDLGGPAYRKYDLEAWMPGRGDAPGEYGEVTSTSNCTDYQARRLGIRYRHKGEKGTSFVHTLNGTAIAISRALIAVLENYQQADGSIVVPEALRAWMGKERITAAKVSPSLAASRWPFCRTARQDVLHRERISLSPVPAGTGVRATDSTRVLHGMNFRPVRRPRCAIC